VAQDFSDLAKEGGPLLQVVRGKELQRRAEQEMEIAMAHGQTMHHNPYHPTGAVHRHRSRTPPNAGRQRGSSFRGHRQKSFTKGTSSASLMSSDASRESLMSSNNVPSPTHHRGRKSGYGKMASMPDPHDRSNVHLPARHDSIASVGGAEPTRHRSRAPPAPELKLPPEAAAAGALSQANPADGRRNRSLSPMVDYSSLTDTALNNMQMGGWGDDNPSAPLPSNVSPVNFRTNSPHPSSDPMAIDDLQFTMAAEDLTEKAVRLATTEVKEESRVRIETFLSSVEPSFITSRPSLLKLQNQLAAVDRLEEFMSTDLDGTFDPNPMSVKERSKQKKRKKNKKKTRRSSTATDGGGDDESVRFSGSSEESQDDDESETDGSEGGRGGKASPSKKGSFMEKKEKIAVRDNGEIELCGLTTMQPLLRQVNSLFEVQVRAAKSQQAVVKSILELYKTVADMLVRDGHYDFQACSTLSLLGFDQSRQPKLIDGKELRDFGYSSSSSPMPTQNASAYVRERSERKQMCIIAGAPPCLG
jgi:hypothetical protein